MKIYFMEHPREIKEAYCNDIANTPLSSCLIIPSLVGNLSRSNEIRVGDGFLKKQTYEELKKDICAFQPQIIGIHMVYQWDEHQSLKEFLRAIAKETNALFVAFGFYPTFAYEDILNRIPELNAVILGEPENAFFALAENKRLGDIPSLILRSEKTKYLRNPIKVVENIDHLAYPEYSPELLNIGEINIEGSRGCYNHCTFCYINDYYGNQCRWRGHSPDYIVHQIEELIKKTGKRRFYFVDPNFFGPGKNGQKRALELAEKLKPLQIKFGIEARVNDIHEDTIKALIDAGLDELLIGLESGSQRCLDRLRKNTTVEQNERALAILRKVGLKPNIGFIMFQPDSTPEDIRTNFSFLQRNQLLEDVKITANLLYHNQILLQGSQCYREQKDLPSPKPYHMVLPYENKEIGQLADFMRNLTNQLFRTMTPLWSKPRQEAEPRCAAEESLNQFLVNTFEEVLSHIESHGCYGDEELKGLSAEKEKQLEKLCHAIYAAFPAASQ